jgi:hypothetical protein
MPPEKEAEVKDPPETEIPEAAKKILDAVKKQLDDKQTPPDPQSDPHKQVNDWREAKKKEMGWTDAQLDSYQRDLRSAQAPLLKDNALLKLRTAHKDFGQLEKAFNDEVSKYEKNGRIIDSELAEELFYMVKGRELSAGRYRPAAPSSQPQESPQRGEKAPSRMAPAYNPSDPGNGGADKTDDAMGQLSEDEKASLDFIDRCASQIGQQVTAEDYVKEREAKKRGRREVVDRAVKPIEIDVKSANPADRDLAHLWNRSAAGRRAGVR